MPELWFYRAAAALPLSYQGKIMLVAFIGTHVPLIALITYLAFDTAPDFDTALRIAGTALAATLAGTAATLFALHHLLRPIAVTARGLRRYATYRVLPGLPTRHRDEAGTLMADADRAIGKLDSALDELANRDPVTGLPNRKRLLQLLADRMGDGGARLALCVVGVPGHDRVASAFGQGAADAVDRILAERLEAAIGPGAAAARLAPGLFAFVLDAAGGSGDRDLAGEARGIAAALGAEVAHGEVKHLPEPTVGVALCPEDARDPEALVNAALSALSSARRGESPVAFFSPASREGARRRFLLEHDLRRALERDDEFVLHYQPVVDAGAGRIVGAEALVRWRHPERGLVPPGEFIPVAEACGLIDPLGLWVTREACRQTRLWSGEGLGGLRIAVNLSARQFADRGLVAAIAGAMEANALGAGALEVEMTETAAMRDRDHTRRVFGELRELGATVAIDDFGTGYSSMSYLKDLPFDKLKIDREFVAGVEGSSSSQAICGALVELAKGLGIAVLAEGAETSAEVRRLRGIGCDLFQGFYVGKPMPADAFAARLRGAGASREIAAAAAA